MGYLRASTSDQLIFGGLALRCTLIGPALLVSLLLSTEAPIRWDAVAAATVLLVGIAATLAIVYRREDPSGGFWTTQLVTLAAYLSLFFAIVAANDPTTAVPMALPAVLLVQAGNRQRGAAHAGWAMACAAYIGGMVVTGLPRSEIANHLWIFGSMTAIFAWTARFLVGEIDHERDRARHLAELASSTTASRSLDTAVEAAAETIMAMTGADAITVEDLDDATPDLTGTHDDAAVVDLDTRRVVLHGADDRTQLAAIAALLRQVNDREEHLTELERLTRTDPLTGAGNRLVFEDVLEQTRPSDEITVVMVDLDHFKAYNDDHGHLAGDEVLRRFAALLSDQLRAPDVVVRWGGEEFCLLMNASPEEAARVIRRIRSKWSEMSDITFSAGIARSESDPDTHSSLVDRADAALYEAKRSGRNRTVVEPAAGDAATPGDADRVRAPIV